MRKELGKLIDIEYSDTIWTTLDFNLPSYREEENALYYLHKTLRDKYKIQFPTFELAYAVYWQKTHPQSTLNKDSLPMLDEAGILSALISTLGQIPIIGLIPGVAKTVLKSHKFLTVFVFHPSVPDYHQVHTNMR